MTNKAAALTSIHLDPVGGIAGDMFMAALLDAFPALWTQVSDDLRSSGVPHSVTWTLEKGKTSGMAAKRFVVSQEAHAPNSGTFKTIIQRLRASALPLEVVDHAIGIYTLLGEVESNMHGVPLDQVHFHEIADWDSWVDIVAAASLITHLGPVTWSVGDLPLGGGRITTAHGLLPVPAPATAGLLKGFRFVDDSVNGERITPTGAAILRYLIQDPLAGPPSGRHLVTTGHGAGQRTLEGIPNLLRVLVMEGEVIADNDSVIEIAFEVDDMTPEELGVSMDHMNACADVLDAAYYPRFGKKGRVQFALRLIAKESAHETVVDMCFQETSTIGLRLRHVSRDLLERQQVQVEVDANPVGVKIVRRGDGFTAKAENSDLAGKYGLFTRRKLRMAAEKEAEDGAQ